jgi:hypothetical protein
MKSTQNQMTSLLQKSMLMMVALMVICYGAFAQSATMPAPGHEKSAVSPDSPIERVLQANPADVYANKAAKYATILGNPSAYPELSRQDLDRIRNEQNELMDRITYIDDQVKNGSTYEQANTVYQRKMDAAGYQRQATESSTPEEQSGTPGLRAVSPQN